MTLFDTKKILFFFLLLEQVSESKRRRCMEPLTGMMLDEDIEENIIRMLAHMIALRPIGLHPLPKRAKKRA